ncbi:hypothetical protein JVT61DRAFT_14140 [Boletus reticuloceps]|uniref:Uncharacterized protein n=1 Tax=Boletus reticuloceps TaxID=495285 RepID=A0A8I2YD58_9AGAM|nr:hypothetical protein JVT61DRAFT_14140 [Boletus reticuloceps]
MVKRVPDAIVDTPATKKMRNTDTEQVNHTEHNSAQASASDGMNTFLISISSMPELNCSPPSLKGQDFTENGDKRIIQKNNNKEVNVSPTPDTTPKIHMSGSLQGHNVVKKTMNAPLAVPNTNLGRIVTVQTILPKTTSHLIDETQITQYSDVLKGQANSRRIYQLSNYAKKQANVYSNSNILPAATWGKYHSLSDRSKQLCNPESNEVLTIWITGHIVSTWFERDGYPDKQASVMIMPLSEELRSQVA